jgi:hypothetical protein
VVLEQPILERCVAVGTATAAPGLPFVIDTTTPCMRELSPTA